MRKRKKTEKSSVDKLVCYQGKDIGKRLKLSERFAEDLRICDNALEDAQRLLEKILKRKSGNGNKVTHESQIPRLSHTETSDGNSMSSLAMSPLPTHSPKHALISAGHIQKIEIDEEVHPVATASSLHSTSDRSMLRQTGIIKDNAEMHVVVSTSSPKHTPIAAGQIAHLTDRKAPDEEIPVVVPTSPNCTPTSEVHPVAIASSLQQKGMIRDSAEMHVVVSTSSPKHTPIAAGLIAHLTDRKAHGEEIPVVVPTSPNSTPTSEVHPVAIASSLQQKGMVRDSAEMHVVVSTSSPKHTPIAAGHIAHLTDRQAHDEGTHVVVSASPNCTPTSAGHLSHPTETMEHDGSASACPLSSKAVLLKHAHGSGHMSCPTGASLEDTLFSQSAMHETNKQANRSSSSGQLCKFGCLEAVVAEASSTFVSFLKRLTQHGVVINATTASRGVREFLVTKSLANCSVDKYMGMSNAVTDEVKEATQRDGGAEDQMRAEEKGVSDAHVRFMSPQVIEVPNSELEKVAEELPNLEADKQVDNGDASPDSPLFSTRVFESEDENDDPDGLKHLWDDMELSLACMNEAKRSEAVPASDRVAESCDHNFYKTDDMGMVCSKCGLVGQDPEYIFNYIWGETSSRRRSGNPAVVVQADMVVVVEDAACQGEAMPQQPISQPLVVHPTYKDKLHPHQHDGFQFLQRNLMQTVPSGCILAHAPGTGKTFLIIAFLQSFLTAFPEERPLIVAPKGMLSVWEREFAKWHVDNILIFNLHQFSGMQEEDHVDSRGGRKLKQDSQLQMVKQWRAQKSVLLVGYSTFSRLAGDDVAKSSPELRKLLLEAPGLLVLDEGHCPRNKSTQILLALSQVRTRRRILLSGTLFQNNFDELFNLYHLIRPEFMASNPSSTKSLLEGVIRTSSSPAKTRLAPSPKAKQRLEREHTEWALFQNLGETIRAGDREQKRLAVSQLRQLSEPFVHWYKGQILETLPGLIDLTVMLKLTAKQEQALLSLQTKLENSLERSIQSTKVCIHPTLLRFDPDAGQMMEMPWKETDLDPMDSSKIMFVLDLLYLSVRMNEKVVLFSQYLGPFILLEKILVRTHGWRLKKQILKIEGKTPLEEREFIIDRFNQDPKARILLASIKTCGEGVSLIGASRIVLLDVHFNPAVSRQAVSRAFRIGQRKKVFVYRLVGAGAMEEDAHLKACVKDWLAKQIFEGINDEDYDAYCHDVDPQDVDPYFQSQHLRQNVVKCIRYHFV